MSLQAVFARLRDVLKAHSAVLETSHDSAERYTLEAPVGPATLRSWGGKQRAATIPVAWVQVEKAYVSYHLMGVAGNAQLLTGLSPELRKRMQGKACFNFKELDDELLPEIERVTAASLRGMRRAGFISGGLE
jgi:hypothetical protein